MTILPTASRADQRLQDLGIRDPINFVGAILRRHRATGVHLTPEQWEDLEQRLHLDLCQMAIDYNPDKNSSLSQYAHSWLPRRIPDWYRDEFGDRRYGLDRSTVTLTDNDRETIIERIIDPSVLETVNTAILTPASRRAFTMLAKPMLEEGKTLTEVADANAYTRRWATKAIKTLFQELAEKHMIAA